MGPKFIALARSTIYGYRSQNAPEAEGSEWVVFYFNSSYVRISVLSPVVAELEPPRQAVCFVL